MGIIGPFLGLFKVAKPLISNTLASFSMLALDNIATPVP